MRRYLFMLLALPLSGAPLTDPYALLEPGSRLVYDFGAWNFYAHQGDAPDSVRVSIAGPAGQVGTLNGWIESPDGLESVPFALSIVQGRYSRDGQWTPISLAIGVVEVPDTLWGSLVRDETAARLVVEGDYTIGRGSPYLAATAIGISLRGPGVSMGAGRANGLQEIESLMLQSAALRAVEIPESKTAVLMGLGLILIFLARRARSKVFS